MGLRTPRRNVDAPRRDTGLRVEANIGVAELELPAAACARLDEVSALEVVLLGAITVLASSCCNGANHNGGDRGGVPSNKAGRRSASGGTSVGSRGR